LTEERDQDIARRRCDRGFGRCAWFYPLVERIRLKPAIDGIEGVVDGDVHHRVYARLVKRVVEWSDACLHGGLARVCVPHDDRVAAGRSRECGSRQSSPRPGELGEYAGHKGRKEKWT
jgi:hypothetical protein